MSGKSLDKSTFPVAPLLIPFEAGKEFHSGRLGTQWKIDSSQTGGRFSVIHHQLLPRTLAAPLHRHHREDEHSYVLKGRFGALLGDHVVTAEVGTWVFKPRQQWHTFWNAGDDLCEIIEVISPGGFEDYFRELRDIWPDGAKSGPLLKKYELDMDFDSVAGLCARFDLV
jgi:mannose-6-phosphate isomerase-like protein (cupin superfamily)